MAGEWRDCLIGDIAEVIGGSTPSTKNPANFDGDVPWLTPKDLSGPHDRYVTRGERNLTRQGLANCSAQFVPAGTVLLSSRAPIGYVAIAKNPIATNQGFRNLIIKPGNVPEFLYYWLTANVPELERHASGSTFKEISGTVLKGIPIRVPSETEQRAIAHILGTLDDKIELNRRMNETLEAMARAIFKSWFVDFDPVRAKAEGRDPGIPKHVADLFPDSFEDSELGEIPKGWEVADVGRLAEVTSGKRPPVRFAQLTDDAQVPLWGGNGPMGFVLEHLFEKPILLTGRVGTLGSVFRIGSPCWPSDNTLVVFAKDETAYEFLYFQLLQVDFGSLNRGSTQPLVTQTDLKAQRFVIPKAKFMQYFHKVVEPFFMRGDALQNESRSLAAIRDALLPKLICREIRVKNPERILSRVGI